MAAVKPLKIGTTIPTRTFEAGDYVPSEHGGVPTGGTTGQVLAKVDGTDHNVVWADQSGGDGAASIVSKTYAEMADLIAASELTPGQYYNITDATGTDLGFVCLAVTANTLDSSGVGGYLNADFQAAGDYSGVEALTGIAAGTQQGIWYADGEGGYSTGDVVIWNLLHYQLTDGGVIDGTAPDTNTAAYTLLPKTEAGTGYITAWDVSEFSFANNAVYFRTDSLGNYCYGSAVIPNFQWGNTNCYKNFVFYCSTFSIKNLRFSTFNACQFYAGSQFYDIVGGGAAEFVANTLEQNAGIFTCNFGASTVQANFLFPGATIQSVTLGDGSTMANNILENSATISNITAGASCSISRNKIGQVATMGGSTVLGDGATMNDNELKASAVVSNFNNLFYFLNNVLEAGANVNDVTGTDNTAQFRQCKFGAYSTFDGLLLGSGSIIRDTEFAISLENTGWELEDNAIISECYFGINTGIETLTLQSGVEWNGISFYNGVAYSGGSNGISTNTLTQKKADLGFSNFNETIDITGLTTLDWLTENSHVGIGVVTSSNATETIDAFTNAPTLFPFRIKPAAGLALTITGTAISGIAAGQFALTTASVTLDGDKGEYIEFELHPSGYAIEKSRVAGIV